MSAAQVRRESCAGGALNVRLNGCGHAGELPVKPGSQLFFCSQKHLEASFSAVLDSDGHVSGPGTRSPLAELCQGLQYLTLYIDRFIKENIIQAW